MTSYTAFLIAVFLLVVISLGVFLYVTWRGENPRVPKDVEPKDFTVNTSDSNTDQ